LHVRAAAEVGPQRLDCFPFVSVGSSRVTVGREPRGAVYTGSDRGSKARALMSTTDLPADTGTSDELTELRESEARLRQLVENTTVAMFVKDSQGRYVLGNREFERLTQRATAELVGRTDRELFPPDLAARFRNNDLRVLLERRPIEFEETAEFFGEERTYL